MFLSQALEWEVHYSAGESCLCTRVTYSIAATHIIRNAHARVMEAENSITRTIVAV